MHFHLRRLTLEETSDVAQIDSFGGGPDYEMFLNAVQSVGTHHGRTEAKIMLKDKAREYYGDLLPIEKHHGPNEVLVQKHFWQKAYYEL
ncbi:hypothetical protein JTB14_004819 [Gonioctena quinquepunctata]|nr:hypothetical protein JTB14_004819 [Gonioctena quinquepunctata]